MNKSFKRTVALLALTASPLAILAQNTYPATGPVGIGTANPQATLDVVGTTQANMFILRGHGGNSWNSHYNYAIYQEPGEWIHPYPKLVINYHTGIKMVGFHQYGGMKFYTGYTPGGTPTDVAFSIGDGDHNVRVTNNLHIGQFGVNQSKLILPGVYNFEKVSLGQDGNGNNSLEFINHNSTTNSYGVKMGTSVDTYGSGLYIVAAPSASSYETLQYATSPAIFVHSTNTVGIGTNQTHGYKLAVGGNMIAERVKVKLQSNWPDYVFRKDYTLPTLQQVDQFISRNGHLPDVPSAAEVKRDGIDMEDMNKALLRKIEELTLYLIEMDKQVKALQEANKVLEKKIIHL